MDKNIKKYAQKGLPIFPVYVYRKGNKAVKQPLIKEWQKIGVGEDLARMLFDKRPTANAIGMVTGAPSKTFVLDVDLGADMSGKPLPPTPCARTGSGGMHYYFKYVPMRNTAGKVGENIDTRGDGGFVVLPPSDHPMGRYEWVVSFDDEEMSPMPEWLVRALGGAKEKMVGLEAYGVPESMRNVSAARVIGHILSKIHPNFWLDFGLGGLREWNKRNTPPLPDDELVKVFKSIAATEYAKRK